MVAKVIGYVSVPRKEVKANKAFPRAFIRMSAAMMQCEVTSLESELDDEPIRGGGLRISVFFTVVGTDANIKQFNEAVKDVYSRYHVQLSA